MALQVRAILENENLYFRFRSKVIVQLYIRVTGKGQANKRCNNVKKEKPSF